MPYPFNPENYEQELQAKRIKLQALLKQWQQPELETYRSPKSHYRMRAEFRVWHEEDRSFFVMFDPSNPKVPVEVSEFQIGSTLINKLMTQVLEAVHDDQELRRKLFQVEFLTTQTNDALVTLIYHRQLDDHWAERARKWQQQWGYPIIGRARKQRLVLDRDFVRETLVVNNQQYHFNQYENSFTQPNAHICEQMVSWAMQNTGDSNDQDLLELYCGNGNFSIPLAANFRSVLGTEISRVSVRSAQENISGNNVTNVKIARMSSEDLSQAWLQNQPSRRFSEFNMDQYQFSTILVDPPRAGLDDNTEKLLTKFDNILYISCNPESMAKNIEGLRSNYEMAALALFDQFPYTKHMECGVLLKRK